MFPVTYNGEQQRVTKGMAQSFLNAATSGDLTNSNMNPSKTKLSGLQFCCAVNTVTESNSSPYSCHCELIQPMGRKCS